MKKKMILILLAVFAVSFCSTSFAAPKAAVKALATNPLVGKWTFSNRQLKATAVDFVFTVDKVTITVTETGSKVTKYTGSYKYSTTPITFHLIDDAKKASTAEMTYTISGELLTFTFSKVTGEIAPCVYQKINSKTKKIENSKMLASKDDPTPDPADKPEPAKTEAAANPLVGEWTFSCPDAMTGVRLTFTADKVILAAFVGEGAQRHQFEGDYTFGKSPIILKVKDEEGNLVTITMTYKIKDDELTYRFTKVVGNIDEVFYKNSTNRKFVLGDIKAHKR